MRDGVLKMYLFHCKFRHALAFFQWRAKNVETASIDQLEEVFNGRVAYRISMIKKSQEAAKNAKKEGKKTDKKSAKASKGSTPNAV